jgi:hypothetical protein
MKNEVMCEHLKMLSKIKVITISQRKKIRVIVRWVAGETWYSNDTIPNSVMVASENEIQYFIDFWNANKIYVMRN